MSDHIGIVGTLEAQAGILREHATERAYPFTMEAGDILHVGQGQHIHFEAHRVFETREAQDRFVADWLAGNPG